MQQAAKGTARAAIDDPRVYRSRQADETPARGVGQVLGSLAGRIGDNSSPGSGLRQRGVPDRSVSTSFTPPTRRSNDRLQELRGHRTLFDLDRQILQDNLYGVDLNEEAIEICRLSLWIKTAQRGKVLTSLDHNIRVGNSVVNDPAVDPKAFDWQAAFPEVFAKGGFEWWSANPPYVRQELLGPIKPHLQAHFASYHGMADLYVYFYELGMRLLRPGGHLSFVVTNKWMKAGYGEPLRRFFAENAWIESVVDFGHAKQIFEDADVFPCDHRTTQADG